MEIHIETIENGYLLIVRRKGYDRDPKLFCRTKKEILAEIERKLSVF